MNVLMLLTPSPNESEAYYKLRVEITRRIAASYRGKSSAGVDIVGLGFCVMEKITNGMGYSRSVEVSLEDILENEGVL